MPAQVQVKEAVVVMLTQSPTRMTTTSTVTVQHRVPACHPALSCRLRGLPEGNAGRAGILVIMMGTATTIMQTANLPVQSCHLYRHRPAALHTQAAVSRKASTAMTMMATTVKMMPLRMQEVLVVLLALALVRALRSGWPA